MEENTKNKVKQLLKDNQNNGNKLHHHSRSESPSKKELCLTLHLAILLAKEF